MSALSCTGMRRERAGRTVLSFKIETFKEAKLTHDKLLNSQFWREGEKKKSLFISEMKREIAGTKIHVSFSVKSSSHAWRYATRVGDFTSSPLHKRLPNSLRQTRQNKNVKYILAARGLKPPGSIKGSQ